MGDRHNKLFFKKTKYRAGRARNNRKIVRLCQRYASKAYISVDKKRNWSTQLAVVISMRVLISSGRVISLIRYSSGSLSYINTAHGLMVGDYVYSKSRINRSNRMSTLGWRLPLSSISRLSIIYNLDISRHGCIASSPGAYCYVVRHYIDLGAAKIHMPSGKRTLIGHETMATLGRRAGVRNKYEVLGSAGEGRRRRRIPIVRGVAMNPVDHPHGGRTKSNSPEVSPWGWVTKFSH